MRTKEAGRSRPKLDHAGPRVVEGRQGGWSATTITTLATFAATLPAPLSTFVALAVVGVAVAAAVTIARGAPR